MNKHHVKYLLIGGGVASASAAQAIRAADSEGAVLLIAQEATRPYHRPPLSNQALRERQPRTAFFTHPPAWFSSHGIELRTGRRAVHLDTARQTVLLDDAQEISYDKLLIATGAAPRQLTIPGSQLPGLLYLRTFEDLERLHHAVDKSKAEGHRQTRRAMVQPAEAAARGRAAVIGSGLLGVELAASLTQMGLEIDLLLKSDLPWRKFTGEATGKWLVKLLEANGVLVRRGSAPVRLEGDGRVQRVVLPSLESVQCDFAVAAVGAVPHRDLLRGTPIAAEKAILTDPRCRTNVANVYAAGDCAAPFDPLFGKHRVLDHSESAAIMGALAGRNMAGADEPYADVNHFETVVFGAKVDVWGESRHVHHHLLRGSANGAVAAQDPSRAGFVELGISADNRVSQVVAVNQSANHEQFKELVRRRFDVTGKEESLKDPTADLAELLK
jgi:3-phenylpropionate/trans-cinnamate dioxygenase ferredoxin reductase component